MDDADKMDRVCGYLRLIERTRLMKNTTGELEQLVGFSIGSGNGLARKGGKSLFIKDAIFRELAHIVRQQTNLGLQDVLDAYIGADRICERMGNVASPALFCQHLVWYFYADAELTDDIAPIIDKVEQEQLPILVLLILKLLPRLSAKGGDVRDIRQDYRRLFCWLSETVNKNIIMQKLPLLTQIEDEVRRNPEITCRIHLISTANQILSSYGALSTRERVSMSNRELLENQFDPEVDGIWTENELSTVFWRFESIANGYHLYCYHVDITQKSLMFTKFFMKFFHWGDDVMVLVIHPHAIHYLVSGKPMPNNLFAYLDCQIQVDDKNNQVSSVSFSTQSADGQWFALKQLRRSEKAGFFQSLLDDERYEKTDNHANDDYDFIISLAAITNDHIYISKDETTYYKVPKSLNDLLDDVGFNSNAGVMSFKNTSNGEPATYIAFDDFNLYYNISTLEFMAEHQIEVVDSISA
jgi:hypothetical protein